MSTHYILPGDRDIAYSGWAKGSHTNESMREYGERVAFTPDSPFYEKEGSSHLRSLGRYLPPILSIGDSFFIKAEVTAYIKNGGERPTSCIVKSIYNCPSGITYYIDEYEGRKLKENHKLYYFGKYFNIDQNNIMSYNDAIHFIKE